MQFVEFTWLAIHFTRLSRGDQCTQALFNSVPGKTPRNFRVLDVFSIPAADSPWTFNIYHLCEWQLSGVKVTLFHIEENQCDQSFVNSVCPFRVKSWPISAAHWWRHMKQRTNSGVLTSFWLIQPFIWSCKVPNISQCGFNLASQIYQFLIPQNSQSWQTVKLYFVTKKLWKVV